jgi:hypothetical protein
LLGLNKSGVSLLWRSLRKHPDLEAVRFDDASLGGPAPGLAGNALPRKLRSSQHLHCFCHPAYLPNFRLTEADVEPGDREAVTAALVSAISDPTRRVIDASPANLVRSRFFQALFPDARFVAIVRDPYATVSANCLRRTRWGTVEEQSLHWAVGYDLLRADRKRLKHCLLVCYEDLIRDARATLDAVCRHCLIEFVPAMLDSPSADSESNERLIGLLEPHDRVIVSKTCRRTMRKFGYVPLARDAGGAGLRSRPAA